jgi:hypothetical protein
MIEDRKRYLSYLSRYIAHNPVNRLCFRNFDCVCKNLPSSTYIIINWSKLSQAVSSKSDESVLAEDELLDAA